MRAEKPCASALERDPTGSTPCDELINELQLQRVGGSFYTITFKGQSIAVYEMSSGHCDAWRVPGYQRPVYSNARARSGSGKVVVVVVDDGAGATGGESNSDGSATSNSDESDSHGAGVKAKTGSKGWGKGLWRKVKKAAGKE
ncbi:hypothetical protein GP486_004165 [Trichoglossum hirsutum]|uniref:Uncharacterized protein n=1 Tax=Trichoglossum hirsutum TaxID=265104 RepID=A0A9P8LBN3_9PEZI|nr:hypothetical protein GP486_004165 [Trichoglossum hirsutum]